MFFSDWVSDNVSNDGDDISVELRGKYSFLLTNVLIESVSNGGDVYVAWKSDATKVKCDHTQYCLNNDLVQVILKKIKHINGGEIPEGYKIHDTLN